jgi:hypothetical protein
LFIIWGGKKNASVGWRFSAFFQALSCVFFEHFVPCIHQAEACCFAVLAGFEIHSDFKAETDILISWLGPHSVNLLSGKL